MGGRARSITKRESFGTFSELFMSDVSVLQQQPVRSKTETLKAVREKDTYVQYVDLDLDWLRH